MTDKIYVLLDDVIAHIASCERSNMLPVECSAITLIKNVPAADVVEVRHGQWYLDNGCAFCSECKNSFTPGIRKQALFCPRCGCRMMEVEHE